MCNGILGCGDDRRLDVSPDLVEVEKGQSIAEIGTQPRSVIAVVRGLFRLQKSLPDGRRLITGFRFAGDILPRINDTVPWDVTVEAVVPSSICQIDAKAFAKAVG